jgi:hypothetical protein
VPDRSEIGPYLGGPRAGRSSGDCPGLCDGVGILEGRFRGTLHPHIGFPARAGSAPRSPHPRLPSASPTTVPPQGGSGTEPEQALEANKPLPSRTARKLHHPPQSLLSARRLGPAKPPPTTHPKRQPTTTNPPQGGSGTGPERALEANKPPPRALRESSNPPQSLLSARRLGPAKPSPTTHPKRQPNDSTTRRRQDRASA